MSEHKSSLVLGREMIEKVLANANDDADEAKDSIEFWRTAFISEEDRSELVAESEQRYATHCQNAGAWQAVLNAIAKPELLDAQLIETRWALEWISHRAKYRPTVMDCYGGGTRTMVDAKELIIVCDRALSFL